MRSFGFAVAIDGATSPQSIFDSIYSCNYPSILQFAVIAAPQHKKQAHIIFSSCSLFTAIFPGRVTIVNCIMMESVFARGLPNEALWV
jgi:hypothetical protein